MAPDVEQDRLSRRNLVRTAALAGVAAVAGAGDAALAPASTVSLAGLIVRADHALASPGTMSIGVRALIWHPTLATIGVVLMVDSVDFADAALLNAQIADGPRQQIGDLLAERGFSTGPKEIAIQLFGTSVGIG